MVQDDNSLFRILLVFLFVGLVLLFRWLDPVQFHQFVNWNVTHIFYMWRW